MVDAFYRHCIKQPNKKVFIINLSQNYVVMSKSNFLKTLTTLMLYMDGIIYRCMYF